jgi:hypothetical protein
MSACGAIVTFDPKTEAAVRGLWQVIDDAGLPSVMLERDYPPHLTLLVCEGMDLEKLRERLPAFVADHPPLPVAFAGLGVFADLVPVAHLPVTKSPALMAFHSAFWELAAPFVQGESPYYRPDVWFPHLTLDREFPIERSGAILDALLRAPRPAHGLLLNLVIVDFSTPRTGLVELFKARLGVFL